MGKVFVKGPVESPDDLLSKGPRWDAQKQGMSAPQREAIEWLGENKGRVARGAGKVAGAGVGVAAGALQSADSFQQWVGNMVRAGKIGWDAINSKSTLDMLHDKYKVESQAKERIRQDMQPAMDAQAALAAKEKEQVDSDYLQSVDPRFGQKDFMNDVYGNRSIGDAAKLERRSQDNYAAQQRLEALRAQPKYERGAAEQTADELAALAEEPTMVGGNSGGPLPPAVERHNNRREVVNDLLDEPETSDELVPTIGPADNAASVATTGGVGSSAFDAVDENANDAAMEAKVNEQGLNDNSESTLEALQQQGGEKEEPNLEQATGGATQVPMFGAPANVPTQFVEPKTGDDRNIGRDALKNLEVQGR